MLNLAPEPRRFRNLLCLAFALFISIAPPVSAQVARMEIISFQSTTLTDQQFLTGSNEGKPVTLAGELRLPRLGTDRLPAVVLLHGSGGISSYVTDWEHDLNAMGIATFVIDTFTARGIVNTNFDQSQLSWLTLIEDAYRALDVLTKHPRIDPARIALMGFSSGGYATLYAGINRFQRMHASNGNEFAVYIPFYAVCDTSFRDGDTVTKKPIRLYHGGADDYAPVAPCRSYVERLKANGADVELTEYAGAEHVFDWQAIKKPLKLDKAQTMRRCELAEAPNGVIVNSKTGQPFNYRDSCVEYGPTIAYDEKASAEVRKAIRNLLAATLKP